MRGVSRVTVAVTRGVYELRVFDWCKSVARILEHWRGDEGSKGHNVGNTPVITRERVQDDVASPN